MKLYVSGSPLNSNFTNEDGQILYKVETNIWSLSPTSTITCVVPNDIPREGEDTAISMQDRFAYFGRVNHGSLSSVLHFGDRKFESKDYFRSGWALSGRHRVFTGIDGLEYKWIIKKTEPKLITNEAKTTVAIFHVRSLGIFGKAHPPYLEILEAGKHMIQEMLVTFIYAEKLRNKGGG